jgi:hypothetical protein
MFDANLNDEETILYTYSNFLFVLNTKYHIYVIIDSRNNIFNRYQPEKGSTMT